MQLFGDGMCTYVCIMFPLAIKITFQGRLSFSAHVDHTLQSTVRHLVHALAVVSPLQWGGGGCIPGTPTDAWNWGHFTNIHTHDKA